MRASRLGLLLLILGFGLFVEAAWDSRAHISIGASGCRVLSGRFYGPSFEFEDQARLELTGDSLPIVIGNSFGDVKVSPGEGSSVEVQLRKVVYRPTRVEAEEFAEEIRVVLREDSGRVVLETNRADLTRKLRGHREIGFETHLSVQVPAGSIVRIDNSHGAVHVEDMGELEASNSYDTQHVSRISGPTQLTNRHGRVSARHISGTLRVASRYADVEIEDVDAAASLDMHHGDVQLRRVAAIELKIRHGRLDAEVVGGELTVRGSHASISANQVTGRCDVETTWGDVTLQNLADSARATASHGELRISDVAGSFDGEASYKDAEIERVGGKVTLRVRQAGVTGRSLNGGAEIATSGDDVLLERFAGSVKVNASRGNIVLRPIEALTDDLLAVAEHGNIVLELPASSRFDLDATARRGQLELDPELELSIRSRDEEGRSERVKGSLGSGGATVTLRAERGDVRVKRDN